MSGKFSTALSWLVNAGSVERLRAEKKKKISDWKMESCLFLESSGAACYFQIITEGNQISRSIPLLMPRLRETSGFQLDI